MDTRTTPRTGLAWLVVAGVSWGTAGTLGTLLRDASGLGFLAVAGYRIAVGGALVLAVLLLTRRAVRPRTSAGWTRVGLLVAASAVYQVSFFGAVGLVGVALATLVAIGSCPLMVVVVDLATGRQRLDVRLGIALGLALVGLVLLVGTPPAGLGGWQLAAGVGSALLAGAAFGAISVLGARPIEDFHDGTGTGVALLAGGAALLAVAALTGQVGFAPTLAALGLVVALGLIPTALAYLSYLRGLRTQSSTTGALVALLEPLTGTLLATLLLGERLTAPAVAGALVLLGAVALTASRGAPAPDRRRKRQTPT